MLVVSDDIMATWTFLAFSIRGLEHAIHRLVGPSPLSALQSDDDAYPQEKSSDWGLSYLKASAEHLTQWADLVVPLIARSESDVVEHHFRPQLTLGRCGLEAASQAVWALGPDDSSERLLRHFRLVLWDLGEEERALTIAGDSAGAGDAREKATTLLSGASPNYSRKSLGGRMTYLPFIEYSADLQDRDPRGWERLWRSASGAAHGRRWITKHSYQTPEGPNRQGVETSMREPKLAEITHLVEAATATLTKGFSLYCDRAGIDEKALLINGAIHTLDVTPAGPGMEQEKLAARLHFEAVKSSMLQEQSSL
ncbi:hypothetical protein [Pseudarthrobacter chlorophenolicus]|uniref:hypothetical protein n=1 Tax=Pseudarthrobacter chlorophenolicus TaxID=85085 RepID=UPI003899AEA8